MRSCYKNDDDGVGDDGGDNTYSVLAMFWGF